MKIEEFSSRLKTQGSGSGLDSFISLAKVSVERLVMAAVPGTFGWVPWPSQEQEA